MLQSLIIILYLCASPVKFCFMDFEASLVDVSGCVHILYRYHLARSVHLSLCNNLFACNSFLWSGFYYSSILPTFRHFTIPEFSLMFCIIYLFPLYYFQPIYVVELKSFFTKLQLIFVSFLFEIYSANWYLLTSVFRHFYLIKLLVCQCLNLPYCFLFGSFVCHSSILFSYSSFLLYSCGLFKIPS